MTRIKATHWKELQGLIAFQILEGFYESGDSKNKKTLQQDLYNIFHGLGPGEPVSYASLAFHGHNPFSRLYESVETGTGNNELHISSSFTRDPSTNVVAGKSFSEAMLKQSTLSSNRPVAGLSLWNRADEIHRNCKKAVAFAKDKLKPDGSFQSGTNNADDFWEYVLDKMYEYLKVSQNKQVATAEDDDGRSGEQQGDDDNEEDSANACGGRPEGWYFCGFWAFQLYGPLAPLEEKSGLFNLDSLDALAVGRKAIRAAASKASQNKTAADPRDASVTGGIDGPNAGGVAAAISPSGFKSGIGIKEKTAIVHLAQQQMMANTRDDELEFETMSKSIDVLKDELNFALAIVRELKITDKQDEAWKTVFLLQKQLSKRNLELTEFQARKRKKREEDRNNGTIFDSFLKSVNPNYQVPPSVYDPSTPVSVDVPSTPAYSSSVSSTSSSSSSMEVADVLLDLASNVEE